MTRDELCERYEQLEKTIKTEASKLDWNHVPLSAEDHEVMCNVAILLKRLNRRD